MELQASGGLVLFAATAAALVWANSPWGGSYHQLWTTPATVQLGGFDLGHLGAFTVRDWVNDGLMAVFFFVVALEIKREVAVGELSDLRAAALPALAAIGGLAVPAAIYMAFNAGTVGAAGWAIPMATDIAFVMGVLALAGDRVPLSAKLFLLALAIVDDLGAILVIALFYTGTISLGWLAASIAGIVVVAGMRRAGVRTVPAYVVVGAFVWLAVLEAGVHPTIAGVALGLMTPLAPLHDPRRLAGQARAAIAEVDEYVNRATTAAVDRDTQERAQASLRHLADLANDTLPPLDRLEHNLARWSTYAVVPVFALANAGVVLSADLLAGVLGDTVLLGVFFGLVVGKPVGVLAVAWIAVRTGVAKLPPGVAWRHMVGLGLLAGIGFTVALFVTSLAFADAAMSDSAKVGILAASLVAATLGLVWFRVMPEPRESRA
jgi:Na+:H+ antiporter, NhaA family